MTMQKWYQIFQRSTGLSPYVWVLFIYFAILFYISVKLDASRCHDRNCYDCRIFRLLPAFLYFEGLAGLLLDRCPAFVLYSDDTEV